MLSIAVVVLGTLAAWTATVAFRQDKEIDSFAEAKPAVYAIPAPTAERMPSSFPFKKQSLKTPAPALK